MSIRDMIVEEAETWLGTPFVHQGMEKGKAVDCVHLIYAVGLAVGIPNMPKEIPTQYRGYARNPDNDSMIQACNEYLVPTRFSILAKGDIILMDMGVGPKHLAIYTGSTIIHALYTATIRKCSEHSLNKTWRERIRGYYRFKGV